MPTKRGASKSEARPAKRVRTLTSRAVEQIPEIPASPACPGIAKTRPQGPLSRLPPGSDVVEAFTRLREDETLSNEEALLELLANYDVPLTCLSRLTGNLFLPMIKTI
jgi:hypothetical protein